MKIVLQDQVRSINEPFDLNGAVLKNAGTPTDPDDLVTKAYVDALGLGFDFKNPVRTATTAPLDIVTFNNTTIVTTTLTIGGVTVAQNDRVLVKDETNKKLNGIYYVSQINGQNLTLTRTDDGKPPALSLGAFVIVLEGANANSGYILVTPDPITLGTSDIVWVKFPSVDTILTAGAGVTINNNVISVNVDNDTIEIDSQNKLRVRQVPANKVTINAPNGSILIANDSTIGGVRLVYETQTVPSTAPSYTFNTNSTIFNNIPVQVYRNGVLLSPNTYNVGSNSVVINTRVVINDLITVIYYTSISGSGA